MQAISAGGAHSLFLKTDGTAWTAGYRYYGQPDDGTSPVQVMSGVQAISAGYSHSLFLKSNGTVWATGWNYFGQLGDGNRTDGVTPPVQVMSEVQTISAGYYHSLFLKTDGTVSGTGSNNFGQLGDGTATDRTTPVQVQGMSGVQAISAGGFHSLFLKTDAAAWAAGCDSYGELGYGSWIDRTIPVPVTISGMQAISAGYYHSLFLKTDGTFWAAGFNYFGGIETVFGGQRTPVEVLFPTPWQQEQFGEAATNPEIAGWLADPDHDGIPNLLEYAGNLPPLQGGTSVLVRGTGTSGLPSVAVTSGAGGPVLSIQYLRRKASTNPGITCMPQFSSTLEKDDSWSAATGTETVESIDAEWERVTVTDTVSPVPPFRFARVKVVMDGNQ